MNKSYKSYEIFKTQFTMRVKMWLGILKTLLLLQVAATIFIGFMALTQSPKASANPFSQQEHNFRSLLKNRSSRASLGNAFQTHPVLVELKQLFPWTFSVYALYPLILIYFRRRGRVQFNKKTLRGAELIDEKELARLLRKEGPGFQLTEYIRIPRKYENEHFLITGAPGTGKTRLFMKFISEVKAKGAKAVVADNKAGEFIAKFYNSETDMILNPFDKRSPHWNFNEIFSVAGGTSPAFLAVAASIIPEEHTHNEFFSQTARQMLASFLKHAYVSKNRSISYLANELSENLRTTFIQAFTEIGDSNLKAYIENPGTAQTQGAISSVIRFARIFEYMVKQDGQKEFSLIDWLNNDKPGIIFLANHHDQQEELAGIFALFLNTLGSLILRLRDNLDRRIFLLLDEFGSLKPIPIFYHLLKDGRSKGVAAVIGIQERAQLIQLYGEAVADMIINYCNCQFIFKMNDPKSTDYFSKFLGEAEQQSMESTYSTGAVTEGRDGESYNKINQIRPLVMSTQLSTLEKFHFYAKMQNLPVALTKTKYEPYPDITEAYVPGDYFSIENLKLKSHKPPTPSPKVTIRPEDQIQPPKPQAQPKTMPSFSEEDFEL